MFSCNVTINPSFPDHLDDAFTLNTHSMFAVNANASSPLFVCVEVLRPSQPKGVMLSVVSLPNLGRLSPLSG